MTNHLVVCVRNAEYEVSLEVRKIYQLLIDDEAESLGMFRVIDESGEDYLYPKELFAQIELPSVIEKQLLLVA